MTQPSETSYLVPQGENIAKYAKKVGQSRKKKAKLLFLAGMDPEMIAKACKVDIKIINYWIFGADANGTAASCWWVIKEERTDNIVQLFIKEKYKALEQTAGMALLMLHDGLISIKESVEKEGKQLSLRELRSLSEIVSDVDKIARLENGQATEIVRSAGLSAKEARKILEQDPFAMGIIPVEPNKEEPTND